MVRRYLYNKIREDLEKKMVFVTGPRQVGKTTLAKSLQGEYKSPIYLNNDDIDDSVAIRKRSWPRSTDFLILDELHKLKNWKRLLKGTFDTRPSGQRILVTGSARLETFRQSGPSLAGRYYHHRLNPLSVKELCPKYEPYDALAKLNDLGGFPEPFFSNSMEEAQRWRRQYFTDIVREDILDFGRIHELRAIRLLVELLRRRVGAPVSYSSLAVDLQVAPNTVRKYISILESLYIVFSVRPFHRNIARAILKEPKIYFYDSGYVEGAQGVRLENTAAVCLLKHVQFLQDAKGQDVQLHYLRTKEGREIDFALTADGIVTHILEVKLSEETASPHFRHFRTLLPDVASVQLVHNLRHPLERERIQIAPAGEWFANLAA